jgi:hypothetical protein
MKGFTRDFRVAEGVEACHTGVREFIRIREFPEALAMG